MKKFNKHLGIITLAVVVGLLLAACATRPAKTMLSLPRDVVPGPDETELFIDYFSHALFRLSELLNVYIDGELVAQATPESSERVIVKNGHHQMVLREAGKRSLDNPIQFEANSEKIIFKIVKVFGLLGVSEQTQGTAIQLQ